MKMGRLRHLFNIYINRRTSASQRRGEPLLKDGDEVSIVPAIAGGGMYTFSEESRFKNATARQHHSTRGGLDWVRTKP